MAFGHLKAVGLEVEGPFRSAPKVEGHVMEFKNEHMPHCQTEAGQEVKHYMECVSDILRFPKHVEDFFNQIEKHYCEKAIVPGMGFHVHFSLTEKKHYDLLLSKHFNSSFFSELFSHFKNDKELLARPQYRSPSGTNFYVMEHPENYWTHRIVKARKSQDPDRYYAINYWCAYNDHQTYEIRIFPSNSVAKMKEYLDWTIEFINRYINDNMGADQINLQIPCIIESSPTLTQQKLSTLPEEIEVRPRKKVKQLQGVEIPWRNLNENLVDEEKDEYAGLGALFG